VSIVSYSIVYSICVYVREMRDMAKVNVIVNMRVPK